MTRSSLMQLYLPILKVDRKICDIWKICKYLCKEESKNAYERIFIKYTKSNLVKSCCKSFQIQLFYSLSSHWRWTFWQVNIVSHYAIYMLIDSTTSYMSIYNVRHTTNYMKRSSYTTISIFLRVFRKTFFAIFFSPTLRQDNEFFSHENIFFVQCLL